MHKLENFILATDSYKLSHWKFLPEKTQALYSYFESRGGEFDYNVFFGLQYYLDMIQKRVFTKDCIDEAEYFSRQHFSRSDVFSRSNWEYILKKYDGYLPIRIKAVPEGTIVPSWNVLMSIESTDEKCAWLTNYVETLLVKVWYPTTIATQSHYIRSYLKNFLALSGDTSSLPFRVHDFGYRGVTCEEQAAIGAGANLISFMGTDTIAGIRFLQQHYGAEMCGFSIPATEHMIMCAHKTELEACAKVLKEFPNGFIACVSDTNDVFACVEDIWGTKLKDTIIQRNGCLVVRPDSGDFKVIVPILLGILKGKFGGREKNGYFFLDDHVRLIQGDGMDKHSIYDLYKIITDLGWSAENLTVGSGGGLLQKVNRDTSKFAFKASAIKVDGEWRDIFKHPVTDKGKASKKGKLKLVKNSDGVFETVNISDPREDHLVPVFENGEILKRYNLEQIKQNCGII